MIVPFNYPEQHEEADQFIADNPGCFVWHDGSVKHVYTGADADAKRAEIAAASAD